MLFKVSNVNFICFVMFCNHHATHEKKLQKEKLDASPVNQNHPFYFSLVIC